MERTDFQELLLQTAFCVVASDGHIDKREIEELSSLEGSAVYFQGVDLRDELDSFVLSLNPDEDPGSASGGPFADLMDKLHTAELSVVQELLLLEVALRILHADKNIHEEEVKLVRQIRAQLNVDDGILLERFGANSDLFESDYRVREGGIRNSNILSEFEIVNDADLTIDTTVDMELAEMTDSSKDI